MKKRIVVDIKEEILINTLINTPVVKLNPIRLSSKPDINSENPIFFGVIGKKSIILFIKKIKKIASKLISKSKNLIITK